MKTIDPTKLQPFKYQFTHMDKEAYEKLKESIKLSGFSRHLPIKVWKRNDQLVIIDGHHRQRAAVELGLKEVPIELLEYSNEREAMADAIQSNKDRGTENYFEVSRAWEELFEPYEKYSRGKYKNAEIGRLGGGFSKDVVHKIRPIYSRLNGVLAHISNFSNEALIELARVKNDKLREALVKYAVDLTFTDIREKATLCNKISAYVEEKVGDDEGLLNIVYEKLLNQNTVFKDSFEALQLLVDEVADMPIRYVPKFIHGDALKMLPKMASASVHLIVTSPPYGALKDYGGAEQITSLRGHKKYLSDLEEVWDNCYRILVPGGRLVIVVGDELIKSGTDSPHRVIPIHADIIRQCISIGYSYMSKIIWQKVNVERPSGGGVFPGSYPFPRECLINQDHENILIFRKPGDTIPESQVAKEASRLTQEEWSSFITSIWKIPGEKKTHHPAPFPQKLVTNLIRMFSFHGEVVLDPMCGSGTTCIAAMKQGRKSIGIDLKKEFIDVSKSLTDKIIKEETDYRYKEFEYELD